jgi:hypothetical protein
MISFYSHLLIAVCIITLWNGVTWVFIDVKHMMRDWTWNTHELKR